MERGLAMSDVRRMQLGQVVDYCIAYNARQAEAEKQAEKQRPPERHRPGKKEKEPRRIGTREAPTRYRLATGKEAKEYFNR